MSTIGYVVIEYNQASHQPDLTPYTALHDTRDAAEDEADQRRAETARIGSRERYVVAVIEEVDVDE